MDIQKNISLLPFNTFHIDAKASYFLPLRTVTHIQSVLNDDHWSTTPKFILGGGSNVLFTRDFPGLVLKNELHGLHVLKETENNIWLKVAAGENWHALVMYCVELGYGGIENLALIPGTVGAAPMQNIGAYGVEIQSVFESLEAIELSTGTLKTFNRDECQFDYRNSIFKNEYKNQYLITSVTLKLDKKPKFNASYGAIQETLKAMHAEPSIRSISEAVIQIRRNKLPDPNKIPNAGSFFKNPIIANDIFKGLQNLHPDIPHFSTDNQHIKIPAAWLIEQCGWKGKKVGKAGVHEHQALVIVNHSHAQGADLKKLADAIQQSVKDQFDILLMPEVNIVE